MNQTAVSILPSVVLLAAVVYGVVTHRPWLWITAAGICVVLLLFFLLFGLGSGFGGAILSQ